MSRAPSTPARFAFRVSAIASSVLFDPVPAITGTRRFTISTVNSMTRLCSSYERVADSPVVPQGTMPFVPLAICHSINEPKACSSIFPFRKGVTMATNEPVNMIHSSRERLTESPASEPLAQKGRNLLTLHQIVITFTRSDHVDLPILDQGFGHPRT